MGPNLGSLWGHFSGRNRSPKLDHFLDSLLMAIWRQLGRFLGCLGALLGGLLFQIYCKQTIQKKIIFIFVSFRHHGSFPLLLDAMLAHFGDVLGSKMEPKNLQTLVLKLVQKKSIFEPFSVPKMTSKNQRPEFAKPGCRF